MKCALFIRLFAMENSNILGEASEMIKRLGFLGQTTINIELKRVAVA
jgi:hypothetical protein